MQREQILLPSWSDRSATWCQHLSHFSSIETLISILGSSVSLSESDRLKLDTKKRNLSSSPNLENFKKSFSLKVIWTSASREEPMLPSSLKISIFLFTSSLRLIKSFQTSKSDSSGSRSEYHSFSKIELSSFENSFHASSAVKLMIGPVSYTHLTLPTRLPV